MKKHTFISILIAIALIQLPDLKAQEPLVSPYLDSAISQKMETAHLAGVSACIIKNDDISWIGNYGYANIEQQIPVDTTTLFYMASVSKTVTATALMQLWEMGLFELDDDVNDYLPFEVHNPYHSSYPVTFRMLCTHTSGIKDNDAVNPLYWGGDSPIPLGQFMYDYLDPEGANYYPAQNFYNQIPGTVYHYSNVGAALTGYLVEVMADSTFWYQTKERIFDPLQMNESAWFLSQVDTTNLAMPYYWNGSTLVPYGYYNPTTYPAGALRTSVNQLAQFLMAYMKGGTHQGAQILEASTIDTMLTSQAPNANPDRGLFWYKKNIGGRWLWGHEGVNLGAMTSMRFYPEENTGVIMFSNTTDEIGYEIIDLLFDYAADSIPCSCLPQGITFTSQQQIDNFQANYPGCTEIEGDVTIEGADISNLNGLNILASIGGNLTIGGGWLNINPVLTSLTGLENLTSIVGYLEIDSNSALTSLAGLDNLTSIGGYLEVYWNHSLISLAGLDNLTSIGGYLKINGNYNLTDITGLDNLATLGGDLRISSNDLTSLSGLESLNSIGGDLGIYYESTLTSLTGLNNLASIGGLHIESNDSLTNLTGLENLSFIGGDVWVGDNNSIVSLTGLEGLSSVGGSIHIGFSANYYPFFNMANPSLTSLSGLENLTTIVGDLTIELNPELPNFAGLSNLESINGDFLVSHDSTLTSFTGLDNLVTIGGDFKVSSNNALTSLSGLENLSSIGGGLYIGKWDNYYYSGGNSSLTNMDGLDNLATIGGDFKVSSNNALTSLSGLENLSSIGGGLYIGKWDNYSGGNSSLTNMDGLDNLATIGGDFRVSSNNALTSLTEMDNLSSIGGSLYIGENDALNSLTGLENVTDVNGNLEVTDNPTLTDMTGLDNLAAIGGDLRVSSNNALSSLSGLETLDSISGNLHLIANHSLLNIAGLEGLSVIGGDLLIGGHTTQGNLSLTSLQGLENLGYIGGDFTLYTNLALAGLTEMENLTHIGGELAILWNSALTSLSGFQNLTSIGGSLIVGWNNALTSLSGLENIFAATITNLEIKNNSALSACEVQSICDYLASPNGDIEIYNNAPGCNSPEEVEEACETVSVAEAVSKVETFGLSPNPFSDRFTIELHLQSPGMVSVALYNYLGQKQAVLFEKQLSMGKHVIPCSAGNLQPGIYLLRLQAAEEIIVQKVIRH